MPLLVAPSNTHVTLWSAMPSTAAVNCCVLVFFTVVTAGLMLTAVIGEDTVSFSCFASLPLALVAFTVKINTPLTVGVPEILPSVARVRPAGSMPVAMFHVGTG